LDLDGAAIGDNGVDGPYVLTSLELATSNGTFLSAETSYPGTPAYTCSQFEGARGRIIGRVLAQNGTAIENAYVCLSDANDTLLSFTRTDSYGNYSFKGLETGLYRVSAVPSDPSLTKETASASVTKGQTTEVDFTVSSRVKIFGDVALLSHSSYYSSDNNLWIAGEVQNIGNHTIRFTKITITYYDSSNQNITANYCYAYLYYLLPGRKAPFQTFLSYESGALQVHRYTFNITHENWPTDKEPALQVLSSSSYTTDFPTALHVNGTIQNLGATDANNPKVVVTFYDAEGTVVGAGQDSELDPILPPGRNLTFDAALYLYQLDKVAYYSVTAESDNYALIPEFQSLTMVPIFTTATLVAVVLSKRKRTRPSFKGKGD
jgi:hypothetical protein